MHTGLSFLTLRCSRALHLANSAYFGVAKCARFFVSPSRSLLTNLVMSCLFCVSIPEGVPINYRSVYRAEITLLSDRKGMRSLLPATSCIASSSQASYIPTHPRSISTTSISLAIPFVSVFVADAIPCHLLCAY
jgi:hypothetical protein